jgi:hypothetical protein
MGGHGVNPDTVNVELFIIVHETLLQCVVGLKRDFAIKAIPRLVCATRIHMFDMKGDDAGADGTAPAGSSRAGEGSR